MFVMDKVVALIALAVAKKASAYAVVRVSILNDEFQYLYFTCVIIFLCYVLIFMFSRKVDHIDQYVRPDYG